MTGFGGPSDPTSSTQRELRRAPVEVLRKSLRAYGALGNVTFLALPTCLLLGIWLDWRWFPTALVPLVGWGLSHSVSDQIEAELERRRAACPDQVDAPGEGE